MSLLYAFIWAGISVVIALWLGEYDYTVLSYGFYTFAGLCLIYPMNILNYKQNNDNQINYNLPDESPPKILQFTCQNCQINEVYLDLNIRKNSKMYSTDVLYTKKMEYM